MSLEKETASGARYGGSRLGADITAFFTAWVGPLYTPITTFKTLGAAGLRPRLWALAIFP